MFTRKTLVVSIACLLLILLTVPSSAGAGGKPTPPPTGPKNVILLIGDGMGPQEVSLGRLVDRDGLSIDRMDPKPGAMTTNNVYGEVTDSAAAATALATGEKSYNGAISVDINNNPIADSFPPRSGCCACRRKART